MILAAVPSQMVQLDRDDRELAGLARVDEPWRGSARMLSCPGFGLDGAVNTRDLGGLSCETATSRGHEMVLCGGDHHG